MKGIYKFDELTMNAGEVRSTPTAVTLTDVTMSGATLGDILDSVGEVAAVQTMDPGLLIAEILSQSVMDLGHLVEYLVDICGASQVQAALDEVKAEATERAVEEAGRKLIAA